MGSSCLDTQIPERILGLVGGAYGKAPSPHLLHLVTTKNIYSCPPRPVSGAPGIGGFRPPWVPLLSHRTHAAWVSTWPGAPKEFRGFLTGLSHKEGTPELAGKPGAGTAMRTGPLPTPYSS